MNVKRVDLGDVVDETRFDQLLDLVPQAAHTLRGVEKVANTTADSDEAKSNISEEKTLLLHFIHCDAVGSWQLLVSRKIIIVKDSSDIRIQLLTVRWST